MKNETHESFTKLLRTFYASKISANRRKIVSIIKSLIDACFKIDDEKGLLSNCETILKSGLQSISSINEESPAQLIKYFHSFMRTKGDADLNYESAERLIKRAGSFKDAKDVIYWFYTADVPEFAEKNSRPFYLHELLGSYSLYQKYNDKREQKRKELIKKYYGR